MAGDGALLEKGLVRGEAARETAVDAWRRLDASPLDLMLC
jgi:hypothetical protein